MTSALFEPVTVGSLTLPNRVVMAPMTRRRCGADNIPHPLSAEYYAQRAGAGLVITEACLVSASGAGIPGSPGIYTQAQAQAWRRVADAVHAKGGRIFMQLWHAGRFSDPLFLGGALPVAPSAVAIAGEIQTPQGTHVFVTPRALEMGEMEGIIQTYRDAATLARSAGMDGVEIHAAQGYLLDQFLRDGANQRTDGYGGSVEKRSRLLLEVTQAAVDVWGSHRVGVQLSPQSTLGGMADSDPEATFGYTAHRLADFPLAYLHVFEPAAPGVRHSPTMKEAFEGFFMVNGGYTAESAEAALVAKHADLVSFGRAYIANPDLVERLRANAPLAAPDPSSFYGGGAEGYTDYPRWQP